MDRVNEKVFQMRASEDWLLKIDDWRRTQPDLPSRSEAVRRLVDTAIALSVKLAKKGDSR